MKNAKLFYIQILLILVTSVITGQTTFTVTNTNNDGEGSLAQAIIDANGNTGADTIIFNIAGEGPHKIQTATTLPAITDPVSILGYSQPGAAKATADSLAKLMIEIDGSQTGDDISGIVIETDSCKIEGITVHSFGRAGIYVHGSFNVLQGNYVGISIDGFQPKGNGFRSSDGYYYDGIWIDASSDNLIGGTEPGDRNVISSNASSNIYIGESASVNNIIQGNFIGPAADGKTKLQTTSSGIIITGALNNILGGSEEGAGNLISGNYDYGIFIAFGGGSTIIKGNFIGTDISGTIQLENGVVGIGLENSNNNQIGGSEPGSGNLISGNGHQFNGGGIALIESSSNNIIKDNFVGTDLSGSTSISNAFFGIHLENSDNNLVGGFLENEGNLISGNDKIGLLLNKSKNNTIKGNIIGLDHSGKNILSNNWDGIQLNSSSSNIIGSIDPNERNIVSGNNDVGISIWRTESKENNIIGNIIGTSIDEMELLPNGINGISILGGSSNFIGGYKNGEGNIIAGNGKNGILIKTTGSANTLTALMKKQQQSSSSFAKNMALSVNNNFKKKHAVQINSQSYELYSQRVSDKNNINSVEASSDPGYSNHVLGNSIYANNNLGIDLFDIDRENDNEDIDKGANSGQNHPEIQNITGDGINATITYTVNSSIENSVYPLHIEFFVADSNGQGKTFLGSDTYSRAEAMTNKSFLFSPSISIGTSELIVATATDSVGNTSEFSAPFTTVSIVGVYATGKIPNEYSLEQNYPNPFNPSTMIKFSLPAGRQPFQTPNNVLLKVYDVLGREVSTLINENKSPGSYEIHFDASGLSSGIYYYVLKSGKFIESKKMLLLK